MYGKVLILFLSTVSLIEAGGMCPDSTGVGSVPCTLVPGCNYNNGTLTPLATQCSNELSDADCEALFPCVTAAAPAANCDATLNTGTAGDATTYPYVRAQACISPALQQIAMKCKF